MTKRIILPIAVAALGLAACSHEAQNETAQAADTVSADANATMAEGVEDVNSADAAVDRALGAAENSIDNAGDAIGNAADDTGDAIDRAGDEIED